MVYYTCLILLLVPHASVELTAPTTQIVGQSLTLECSVTTVRGITSIVDIVWSSDGAVLKREGHNDSLEAINSSIYTDTYTIRTLSTINEGQQIQCIMLIHRLALIVTSNTITLNVTG